MFVRHATMDDLDALACVETACFPPQEAADIEQIAMRVEQFPEHFWLLINPDESSSSSCFPAQLEDGMLVSFINGMTTNTPDLTDEMYENAQLHDGSGSWQMLFGVETAPVYQHRGCGAYLLRRVILDAAIAHRDGLVLACKEKLIDFYSSFGFVDEGKSESTHGNATWHQMRLVLDSSTLDDKTALAHVEAHDITSGILRTAMEEATSYMDNEVITSQFPVLA